MDFFDGLVPMRDMWETLSQHIGSSSNFFPHQCNLVNCRSRFLPLVDAAEENCLLVVVGMKSDKVTRETRPVPPEQPMLLAQRINKRKLDKVPYFEASSLAGLNVEEVFNFIFHTCLPLSKKEDLTRTASASSGVVNLSDSIPPKKGQDPPMARNKSSCCW